MVGVASTNDVVEILTSSEHNPEKGGLTLPHSHIVLIPHPSDDPHDPLVCFMLFCNFVIRFLLFSFKGYMIEGFISVLCGILLMYCLKSRTAYNHTIYSAPPLATLRIYGSSVRIRKPEYPSHLVLLYLILYSCILFYFFLSRVNPLIFWSVYHTHNYPY